ncbi:MAG: hypothetical protein WKG00_16425 [Polyangiaceae bacterium]
MASRNARDGAEVVVAGKGGCLAAAPAGTPGAECTVRIVGDAAVIRVPPGCEARRGASDGGGVLPSRAVESRLVLRPDQEAWVSLGAAGSEPAPLTLHVEVADARGACLQVPVWLFEHGRGHVLAVGVVHAAFLLWSGLVAAVAMDAQATLDLAEMQAALARTEQHERAGHTEERFRRPSGPIESLDAPRSSLLQHPWMQRDPSTVHRDTGRPVTDMEDATAFVVPAAPAVVE